MSAIITEKIQTQVFEAVLYKIAEILHLELGYQQSNHKNIDEFEVFIERMIPYDKSENIMINVTSANINYDSYTQSSAQGVSAFNIEVYAPLSEIHIGPQEATKFKLHSAVGLIRYILQSHKYARLNMPMGCIGNTSIRSISFFDDFNNQDGANIRIATIGFDVKIIETQELWEGIELFSNSTEIKLCNTEKGYKLVKN